MDRKIVWASALSLIMCFGTAVADDHADEENIDDNAAFGISTSDEARAGGVDGLAKAGEAIATFGGDNTDQAEATIATIDDPDAASSDAVTDELPDPEDLPAEAEFGMSTAADARDGGVDGLSIAEEAMGQANEMANEALENVELPSRSDNVPDVPGGAPDLPDVPEPPIG